MRAAAALLVLGLASPALAADPMPNPVLTPGGWKSPATPLPILCKPGYTRTARHVSQTAKERIYRLYHVDPAGAAKRGYRIDHLVPLSLDGSNEDRNLWPETGSTKKDALEDKLHRLVCTGAVSLQAAQWAISKDWTEAYARYVR
ncbi:MAG: endonuclease [Spirosoma sp.]|nr:endonuclease [Spirosoma sp.]